MVGSVLLALLMLVSTQVVFTNTTKAYPTPHAGNANVGGIWITELNVSSELETIANIGVAHVNATDDWVIWSNKAGNVSATWAILAGDEHPEYYVQFALSVFLVAEECIQIGNATVTRTIGTDQGAFMGGTLRVPVSLSSSQEPREVLVCYLGAQVRLNKTEEAINFTSLADDRAVVTASFSSFDQARHKFQEDLDKSNTYWPPMWSWVDDWEDYYDDENDMLNYQTYFNVGGNINEYSGGNSMWYLGNLSIDIHGPYWFTGTFNPHQLHKDWTYNAYGGTWATGPCRMNYSVQQGPGKPEIIMRYAMFCTERFIKPCATHPIPKKTWGGETSGYILGNLQIEDYSDANEDGLTEMSLWIWCTNGLIPEVVIRNPNYEMHNSSGANNSAPSGGQSYYWEEDCAYQNSTFIDVDSATYFGITTVYADISNILNSDDQYIYSYAGDTGDTRVEFTC